MQTVCQDIADEEDSGDEGEAEQDEMLIEYAGEIVPNLGKALGPVEFAQHFPQLLPLFANKSVSINRNFLTINNYYIICFKKFVILKKNFN